MNTAVNTQTEEKIHGKYQYLKDKRSIAINWKKHKV